MKVSVLLPAMNETFSLEKSVGIILSENKRDIYEILIIISPKSTLECVTTAKKIALAYPKLVSVHTQTMPFVGGACRDGFRLATGDYTVLMSSDLETDPHSLKDMIAKIKEGYDIVTCTRWHTKATFKGYNPIKFVLNKIFQVFFSFLYSTDLTDLTFAYRIFRTEVIKKIKWEELRFQFFFETIVKPLRLGYKIAEIPSSWVARKEGSSQNPFFRNFTYFIIGFKTLLSSKSSLVVDGKPDKK